jgi:23S rRNA pseudouridine2605 synthase
VGLCSRREAEAWIAAGRVSVNGHTIASPALDVIPHDRITVDGTPLPQRERTRLFLYHKPRGLLTSHADARGRPTIFAALPKNLPRLISVGRLDLNTEGLLLLTNDGGLARTLELPATGWLRRYRVRAHGRVRPEDLEALHDGITIDGIRYGAIEARLEREQGSNLWVTFAMREGKNREVKNVLGHLGLAVNRLIRVSFGPFQLGDLLEGAVEEVRTRVLRDQLSERIVALAGADFSAPVAHADAPAEVEASARRDAPSAPKRKPRKPGHRRRDAERLGEPELARRAARRKRHGR